LTEDQFNSIIQACDAKWPLILGLGSRREFHLTRKYESQRLLKNPTMTASLRCSARYRLKQLVVEKEYPIEKFRLDVAWKRVAKGNPFAAFEVQIGGNFFEALTKLKHAWDMWSSIPVLVTTDEYADRARELIEGSFHEIRKRLRIVDYKEIKELYDAWKKIDEIENRITLSQI